MRLSQILPLTLCLALCLVLPAQGRSISAPWDPASQNEFQSLVYASSSMPDVHRILGLPDDIVRSEQMYPVIENHYYYEEGGTGAATVFVFENGLLMGMHYKSPENQLIDLTYFLPNNGDLRINWPYRANYQGYFPYFPMVGW